MDPRQAKAGGGESIPLPFDVIALLIRAWGMKWWACAAVAASLAIGLGAGVTLGKRTYEAETTLLFTADEQASAGGMFKTPSIYTQMNLVKLQDNLEMVRDRLELEQSVQSIGPAISVSVQRDTALMFIRGRSDTAEKAADLTNAMRDVFLESYVGLRRSEAEREASQLAARLETLSSELAEADQALEAFSNENQIVDLDKEAQWLLEQYTTTDLMCQQAKVERTTLKEQYANLEDIIDNLREQIARESAEAGDLEGIGWAKIRADRLREKISAAQSDDINAARLREKQAELDRTQEAHRQGLVADADMEQVRMEYDTLVTMTVDSEEVAGWKQELVKLDESIVPQGGRSETASAPILREMMLKSFELQLELAALDNKVESLEEATQKVRDDLNQLPAKQKQFVMLRREVMAREAEKTSTEELLARARRLAESDQPGFAVVVEATPPIYPLSSTRKLMAIAGSFVTAVALMSAIVLMVLIDTTVRSAAECELKLKLPVLASLPRRSRPVHAFVSEGDATLVDPFWQAALKVRKQAPDPGTRLLVAGSCGGEGVSVVTALLAVTLGRRDERVLVVDCNLRGGAPHPLVDYLGEGASDCGLGDYLAYAREDWRDCVAETTLAGVSLLSAGRALPMPDAVACRRMQDFLEQASEAYSAVLLDGPAVTEVPDAMVLAEGATATLLVVRAGLAPARRLRRALEQMSLSSRPVAGVVLNAVEPLFMRFS